VVSSKASYWGLLNAGTPAQEFRVVFDTGSGHVILPSIECATPTCRKHRRYNMRQSSTAVPVNLDGRQASTKKGAVCDSVTINFGTGKVVGEFVRDRVCLGPVTEGGLPTANAPCVQEAQVVMAIDMSKKPFELFNFDGILGLGLGSLALNTNFSFFHNLAGSKKMASSHFGVFLADADAEGREEEASELAIGGHNPARILGPVSWVQLRRPEMGYWQVDIHGVYIGSKRLDICDNGSCSGILDTGTSHLGIPSTQSETWHSLLSTQSAEEEDCRMMEAPPVMIELQDINITLYPENYMRKLPLPESMTVAFTDSKGNRHGSSASKSAANVTAQIANNSTEGGLNTTRHYCTPKLLPVTLNSIGPHVFILGEPVLSRYYTVYDWGGMRAGFSLAAHAANSLTSRRNTGLKIGNLGDGSTQGSSEQNQPEEIMLIQVVLSVRVTNPARRAQAALNQPTLDSGCW